MSARSALEGRLIIFGLSEQAAKRVVDEFAHELAEKIRKEADGPNLIRPEFEDAYWQAMHRAADLIDPEAE